MNRLNESLFSGMSNLDMDDDIELMGAVPPAYADAINAHQDTKKELEDRFKEQEKEKDAFVKDNHKTENKPKGTKEMKKMKLSEALFESVITESDDIKEAVKNCVDSKLDYVLDNLSQVIMSEVDGYDAEWCDADGQTAVSQRLVQNKEAFINSVVNVLFANREELSEQLDSDDEDGWGSEIEEVLSEFFNEANAIQYEVENCRRGSYAINGKKVSDLIYSLNNLSDMLSDIISNIDNKEETLQEAVVSLDVSDNTYYKSKRQPLADIIMRDLTSGEVVYTLNDDGKYVATHAPSLNLDEYDIGANADENGEYIIAWLPTEEMTKTVENIAKRYNRDYKSGSKEHVKGNKFFTKIYLDDEDWDKPYFDPNVKVRVDGRKKAV